MGQRSADLAEQFEQAVADLYRAIEAASDTEWNLKRGPEGWTLAALAQHVSGQFPLEHEIFSALAEGRDPPAYSWDDINAMNDKRAAANTAASKTDVLNELRDGAAKEAAYVRGLSDEQLDLKGHLPLVGAEVTTQQLIEGGVLIDHVRGHLNSIRTMS